MSGQEPLIENVIYATTGYTAVRTVGPSPSACLKPFLNLDVF